MGNLTLNGATSGQITLAPTAVAGTNTLTLPAATDTLVGKATTDTLTNKTLSSPAFTGTVSGTTTFTTLNATTIQVGGNQAVNGPAFYATASTAQSITNSTFVKLAFDTKQFDTNTNYNTSTYRFTPTVAGYYTVTAQYFASVNAGRIVCSIYKNGANYIQGTGIGSTSNGGTSQTATGLVYFNGSTDYVEAYAYQEGSAATSINNSTQLSFFQGVMVRGA